MPTIAAYAIATARAYIHLSDNEMSLPRGIFADAVSDDGAALQAESGPGAPRSIFSLSCTADHGELLYQRDARRGQLGFPILTRHSGGDRGAHGPMPRGSNEAAIRMLMGERDRRENIPAMIKRIKNGEKLLQGFVMCVQDYDPSAKI